MKLKNFVKRGAKRQRWEIRKKILKTITDQYRRFKIKSNEFPMYRIIKKKRGNAQGSSFLNASKQNMNL